MTNFNICLSNKLIAYLVLSNFRDKNRSNLVSDGMIKPQGQLIGEEEDEKKFNKYNNINFCYKRFL